MRKRQFGKGREVVASEHNLAQDYIEYNLREIALDGNIKGIISGGTFQPHLTLEHTITLQNLIARSYLGERIYVPTNTNIFMKPSVDPTAGKEVYVTAYVEYTYQTSEQDTDIDDVVYYKDYQNSYNISTIQGTIANIGSAVRPTIPTNAVLLCDVLYDTTLYASGSIQVSDIDISRQDRFDSQAIVNLQVTGTAEIQGASTFGSDISLQGNSITDVADPTTDNEVGDRGYNDIRYVNVTGDTMTGALTIPDLTVTANMNIEDLNVGGSLTVDDNSVITNDLTVEEGSFSVNKGDASIGSASGGGDLVVYNKLTAKGLVFPWGSSLAYTVGEVVYYEDGIYKCITGHTSTANFVDDIANWESIGGGGGTTHRVSMTAHGFIPGDILRWDSTVDPDGYVKAKADDPNTLGQFVVIRVLDADNFLISSGGYFEDLTYTVGYTPNSWYYLSDTTAGEVTATEPQISNPMLYAITTNEAFVIPYRPAIGAAMQVDEYTATVSQTAFTLTETPIHQDYLIVSIDGVLQSKAAYTWNGTTVTFVTPLYGGEEVRLQYVHNMFAHPGASLDSDEFTVTSTGETQFTLSYSPISKDFIIVSIDGALQNNTAFSLVDDVLIFATPLVAGNVVRVLHIRNLNVIEPPTGSIRREHLDTDNIYGGDISLDGNLSISSNEGIALEVITSTGVSLEVVTSTGVTGVSGLLVYDDVGFGEVGGITLTNTTNTSINTGIGTIRLTQAGTTSDSAGWLKIYIGTSVYYIPVFTDIEGT